MTVTETDAEKAYVRLQQEQDRTDQPGPYPLITMEHHLGARFEEDPKFPFPGGPGGNWGAWRFPDGSRLHIRGRRLYCGPAVRYSP